MISVKYRSVWKGERKGYKKKEKIKIRVKLGGRLTEFVIEAF